MLDIPKLRSRSAEFKKIKIKNLTTCFQFFQNFIIVAPLHPDEMDFCLKFHEESSYNSQNILN